MKRFLVALCIAATLLLTAQPTQAGVIDTTPSWDGTSYAQPLGVPNTATYGQTFTVAAGDTSLDSFSFFLRGLTGSGDTQFAAYVMAWDGAKATGTILYQSAPQNLPSSSSSSFQQYTFTTGGVAVTPGQQYVAFLSVSQYYTGSTRVGMGTTFNEAYTGGSFVFSNNGNDFSLLTSTPWDGSPGNLWGDAAFIANFSSGQVDPIPEPASLTMLGFGLIGMAGYSWRRRRQNAAKPMAV